MPKPTPDPQAAKAESYADRMRRLSYNAPATPQQIGWNSAISQSARRAAEADAHIAALTAEVAELKGEVERMVDALDYAKESLPRGNRLLTELLLNGTSERCSECGCPTETGELTECCDYHGSVCPECVESLDHDEQRPKDDGLFRRKEGE